MRFAYADPPYLGCCRLYEHRHEAGPWTEHSALCWDQPDTHRAFIAWLSREFPDGWALSASTASLRPLLPLCPEDVRVAAWVKTFGAFKRGVRPAYMWEPVIFWRGRNPGNGHAHPPPPKNGRQTTPKDFIITEVSEVLPHSITLKKGFTGAKPEAFCRWVLQLLGHQAGDELVDIFPGSGVMERVLAQGVLL